MFFNNCEYTGFRLNMAGGAGWSITKKGFENVEYTHKWHIENFDFAMEMEKGKIESSSFCIPGVPGEFKMMVCKKEFKFGRGSRQRSLLMVRSLRSNTSSLSSSSPLRKTPEQLPSLRLPRRARIHSVGSLEIPLLTNFCFSPVSRIRSIRILTSNFCLSQRLLSSTSMLLAFQRMASTASTQLEAPTC